MMSCFVKAVALLVPGGLPQPALMPVGVSKCASDPVLPASRAGAPPPPLPEPALPPPLPEPAPPLVSPFAPPEPEPDVAPTELLVSPTPLDDDTLPLPPADDEVVDGPW